MKKITSCNFEKGVLMSKIEVKNIYKVFGSSPIKMLSYLQRGEDKSTLLKEHEHSVGVNNASFHVEEGEIFVVMEIGRASCRERV